MPFQPSSTERVCLLIVLLGIALRISQFLIGRSFWLDEAFLANALNGLSLGDFYKPLRFDQAASPGFVLGELALVHYFGESDRVLRVLPLVFGCASVVLFTWLALHILPKKSAVILSSLVFALSGPLIYYSSEMKPYIFDVFIALLLFVVLVQFDRDNWSLLRSIGCGLVGALSIWCSWPACFVLAGIGLSLTFDGLTQRNWKKVKRVFLSSLFWLASFLVLYFLTAAEVLGNSSLQAYWGPAFVPLFPASYGDLRVTLTSLTALFDYPLGLFIPAVPSPVSMLGLAALLFLVGMAGIWHSNRKVFLAIISPVLITWVASGLRLYPFFGRVLLFLVPFIVIGTGFGISYLFELCVVQRKTTRVMVGALLLLPGADCAVRHLAEQKPYTSLLGEFHPTSNQNLKRAFSVLKERIAPGDTVVLVGPATFVFDYYSRVMNISVTDRVDISWTGDWNELEASIKQLQNRSRVWAIFGPVNDDDLITERFIKFSLNSKGEKLTGVDLPELSLYQL